MLFAALSMGASVYLDPVGLDLLPRKESSGTAVEQSKAHGLYLERGRAASNKEGCFCSDRRGSCVLRRDVIPIERSKLRHSVPPWRRTFLCSNWAFPEFLVYFLVM